MLRSVILFSGFIFQLSYFPQFRAPSFPSCSGPSAPPSAASMARPPDFRSLDRFAERMRSQLPFPLPSPRFLSCSLLCRVSYFKGRFRHFQVMAFLTILLSSGLIASEDVVGMTGFISVLLKLASGFKAGLYSSSRLTSSLPRVNWVGLVTSVHQISWQ